jgi:hypothetical protein
VSAGGWNSQPTIGSAPAVGARMASRCPGRARPAQLDAGPVSPCSTKSMSSSQASRRSSRRVNVRMGGRSSSGIARYSAYQSSPSGTTGSVCPASGKNSLTRWSWPALTVPASSGPPSVTRRRCGDRSLVRTTSARNSE